MRFTRLSAARSLMPLLFLSAGAAVPAQQIVTWGTTYGELPEAAKSGVKSVSGGEYHALALKTSGAVVAFGYNGSGQCNVPSSAQSGVVALAAGGSHSLALKSDGTIVAWGRNFEGQCTIPAAAQSGVVAVSAGSLFSVALKSNGSVVAWGDNSNGECNVPPEAQSGVVAIAAGSAHVLALKSNGSVVGWGYNEYSQCNVPATALSNVAAIAAGTIHSVALKTDGSVVLWGNNYYGQLNAPSDALVGVSSIAAAYVQTLVAKNDGSVVAWGNNDYGQTDVSPVAQSGVFAVASAQTFSMALRAEAWATVDQREVYGGTAATGTVNLANPAGAGGVTVALTTNDAGVHIPATVKVPVGKTSATFPITVDLFFGGERSVTISTSYNGTATVPFRMTLKGQSTTLVSNRPNVIGGSSTSAKLTFSVGLAAASDVTVSLTSSDTSAKVPATFTLPAGQTTVDIPVSHSIVPTDRGVKFYAKIGDRQIGVASLGVKALGASVDFDSPKLRSGDTTYGVLTLSAVMGEAITVPLSSGDPAVSIPATVKVNAGSRVAIFLVNTVPVQQSTVVPITATVGTRAFKANLELAPSASVSSLTLPKFVYGNNKAAGTVVLSRAAPFGGFTVTLASDPALLVPATLFIPEGATRATFEATATDVESVATANVTATGSLGSATAAVEVRPLALTSLALSDTKVKGGGIITGTVTLNVAVGVDTVVNLASDSSFATVPTTVTIPAGSSSAAFTITTKATTSVVQTTITATKGGKSLSKPLKVQP